ncbi:MAG: RNA polymerase factor sigma-54 [Pseudomonadota bacterium]
MKQSLSLKLGQQLTMTPQLQQAIRLLQLSALDLQQEIQTTLESNPMLEIADEYNDEPIRLDEGTAEADLEAEMPGPADDHGVAEQLETPMGEELPVDSKWEDVYSNMPSHLSAPPDNDFDILANKTEATTLADHLLWQLNLTPMAPTDTVIARTIIDAIDPAGLLVMSTEDLCQALYDPSSEDPVRHEDVLAILEVIQDFDPIGVGARDLRECLLLQLDQLYVGTPWVAQARMLIEDHLDLLGAKDFSTLRRKTKLPESELAEAMALIRTLNPRPGSAIASEAADYIVPDVIVRKDRGRWVVELNNDTTPQVRITPAYERLLERSNSDKDKTYIRDNLAEARWFLKSLQTRHDTLLRVASKIVEVQRGFLDYGPEAMKPLILADIAEAVDLHESTISRVTSRKYMATPRGVFELKYFFSSHVGTNTGGEVSSTAIRALIEKLTAEENPRKPLSDSKIAAILKEQNINVARRTVAKYRESMSIPPSNERKQLV